MTNVNDYNNFSLIKVLYPGNTASALLPVSRDTQSILPLVRYLGREAALQNPWGVIKIFLLPCAKSLNHLNVSLCSVYVKMFTRSLNKNEAPFHISILLKN